MRRPQLPEWSAAGAVHLHAYNAQLATAEDHWVTAALNHFGRIEGDLVDHVIGVVDDLHRQGA